MDKKFARVTWSKGRYSDIARTTIDDAFPLRHGQKVTVIWGKLKKEYMAVLASYPLEEPEPAATEKEPAPRRSKAKRKLVSIFSVYFSSKQLNVLPD